MLQNKELNIRTFFSELEKLNLSHKSALTVESAFFLGHSFNARIEGLAVLYEAFSLLDQFDQENFIIESQKMKIFKAIRENPSMRIEKELNNLLVAKSKHEEGGDSEIDYELEECTQFCADLKRVVEAKLTSEEVILMGFLLPAGSTCLDNIEQLVALKELENSKKITHEKKVNLYTSLYLALSQGGYEGGFNAFRSALAGDETETEVAQAKEEDQKTQDTQSTETSLKANSENGEEETKEKENKEKECKICLELLDDVTKAHTMSLCGHVFDTPCVTEYLKLQIEGNKFPVSCPQENCKAEFARNDIVCLLQAQEIKKFYDLSLSHFLSKNSSAIFQCPTPDCSFKLFEAEPDQKNVVCPLCYGDYCLDCSAGSHPGAPCEVNHFMNIARSLALKACPACRHWVERIDGCNHMTCSCGYEFCYSCGKVYGVILDDNGDSICANGLCLEEENYYDKFQKLLTFQEG